MVGWLRQCLEFRSGFRDVIFLHWLSFSGEAVQRMSAISIWEKLQSRRIVWHKVVRRSLLQPVFSSFRNNVAELNCFTISWALSVTKFGEQFMGRPVGRRK